MTIKDYNEAKENELRWDADNEYKKQGHILGILAELNDAVEYWKKRYNDEGGIADTRLDRADSRDFDGRDDDLDLDF